MEGTQIDGTNLIAYPTGCRSVASTILWLRYEDYAKAKDIVNKVQQQTAERLNGLARGITHINGWLLGSRG